MKTMIQKIGIMTIILCGVLMGNNADAFEYDGILIKYGSHSSQVSDVQACMNKLGYDTGIIDGIYGPNTFAGILKFQITIPELVNDGIIGPKTAPFFEQACSEFDEDSISIVETETENEVVEEEYESTTIPEQTTTSVTTNAKTISVDGVANDYAEFQIEFDLKAFGNEFYISQFTADSFHYSIVDAGTGLVAYDSDGIQNGVVVASISSSGNLDGDYYRIGDNDSETFTLSLSYNPYGGVPAGTGSYRLQLDSIEYANTAGGVTSNYNALPTSKFRTNGTIIVD